MTCRLHKKPISSAPVVSSTSTKFFPRPRPPHKSRLHALQSTVDGVLYGVLIYELLAIDPFYYSKSIFTVTGLATASKKNSSTDMKAKANLRRKILAYSLEEFRGVVKQMTATNVDTDSYNIIKHKIVAPVGALGTPDAVALCETAHDEMDWSIVRWQLRPYIDLQILRNHTHTLMLDMWTACPLLSLP
ncbi:hypothetical protein AAMO2058_000025600 [Amorphochlora amoebiformis]